MEATLLLANSAEQNANGTVSALGLGWSVTSTPTPPAALVLLLKVPWDQTNQQHAFSIELVDGDGRPVSVQGNPAVTIQGDFEVGRPPGLPHGTPIDNAMVIPLPPGLPLGAGTTYEWKLDIGGEIRASRSFMVRRNNG